MNNTIRDKIFSLASARGGTVSASQVAAASGTSEGAVNAVLTRLAAMGYLQVIPEIEGSEQQRYTVTRYP